MKMQVSFLIAVFLGLFLYTDKSPDGYVSFSDLQKYMDHINIKGN